MTTSRSHPFTSPSNRNKRLSSSRIYVAAPTESHGTTSNALPSSRVGRESVDAAFNEFRQKGFKGAEWEGSDTSTSKEGVPRVSIGALSYGLRSSREGMRQSIGNYPHIVGGRRNSTVRFPRAREVNGGIGESLSSSFSHTNSHSSLLRRPARSAFAQIQAGQSFFAFDPTLSESESPRKKSKGQSPKRDKGSRGRAFKGGDGGMRGLGFTFPSKRLSGGKGRSGAGMMGRKGFVASLLQSPLVDDTGHSLPLEPEASSSTSTCVDRTVPRGQLPYFYDSAIYPMPSTDSLTFSHNRTATSPLRRRPLSSSVSPRVASGWKHSLKSSLSAPQLPSRSPLKSRTNQRSTLRDSSLSGLQAICVPKPRLGLFAPTGDLNDYIALEEEGTDLFSPTMGKGKGKGKFVSSSAVQVDATGQLEGGSFTRVKRENEASRVERDGWGLRSPGRMGRSRQRETSTNDLLESPVRIEHSDLDKTPTKDRRNRMDTDDVRNRMDTDDVERLSQTPTPSPVDESPRVPRSFDHFSKMTKHIRGISWNDDRHCNDPVIGFVPTSHQRSASHSGIVAGPPPPQPSPLHARSSSVDRLSNRYAAFERKIYRIGDVGKAISNSDSTRDHARPGILSKEKNAFLSLPPRMHHLLFESSGPDSDRRRSSSDGSGDGDGDESLIITMDASRRTSHDRVEPFDHSPMDRFTAVFPTTPIVHTTTHATPQPHRPDPPTELLTLHQALAAPPSFPETPNRNETFPSDASQSYNSRRISTPTFGRGRVLSLSEWQNDGAADEKYVSERRQTSDGSDGSGGVGSFWNLDEEDEGCEDDLFFVPSKNVASAIRPSFDTTSDVESALADTQESPSPSLADRISIRSDTCSPVLPEHANRRPSHHIEVGSITSTNGLDSHDTAPIDLSSHFSDITTLHSRRQTRSTWTTTSFGNLNFDRSPAPSPSPPTSPPPSPSQSFLEIVPVTLDTSRPIYRSTESGRNSFLEFDETSEGRRESKDGGKSFIDWSPVDSPPTRPIEGEEEGRMGSLEMDLFGPPPVTIVATEVEPVEAVENRRHQGLTVEGIAGRSTSSRSRESNLSAYSNSSLVAGFPIPPLTIPPPSDEEPALLAIARSNPFGFARTRPSLQRFPPHLSLGSSSIPLSYNAPTSPEPDPGFIIPSASTPSMRTNVLASGYWTPEEEVVFVGDLRMAMECRRSDATFATFLSEARERE